jgi:TPR repeat protein
LLGRNRCLKLAHAYEKGDGVAKDAGRAAGYYEKACKAGEKAACGQR